jgi:hypothetical protein
MNTGQGWLGLRAFRRRGGVELKSKFYCWGLHNFIDVISRYKKNQGGQKGVTSPA